MSRYILIAINTGILVCWYSPIGMLVYIYIYSYLYIFDSVC
jgi:hypothetical protein